MPTTNPTSLPFFVARPSCGFPSPAGDYKEETLNLQDLLIQKPAATFILRVSGESMRRAGITSGDLVIVDRSQKPRSGQIVVVALDGDLLVKRLAISSTGSPMLVSDPDPDDSATYPAIQVTDSMTMDVWGRVTAVVHFT